MNPFSQELLNAVAQAHGTPTYVYSGEHILEAVALLRSSCEPLAPQICFAVKANSTLGVLQLLAKAGVGADIVSGGELKRAIKAGISPQNIVFSGVGKTREEIDQGLAVGIRSFQVESLSELKRLLQANRPDAGLSLRVNPNIDAKTHPHITTGLRQNKFGLSRLELQEALSLLRSQNTVRLDGLSIHIGSQLTRLAPLNSAFRQLSQLVLSTEKVLGYPLLSVDLGGGVGIRYDREKVPSLKDYGALINRHFGVRSALKGRLRIVLEPGRSLVGNAGVLLSRVVGVKQRGKGRFVILDAGMNDLMRPALYGAFHQIVPVSPNRGPLSPTTLVGPLCESGDVFGPIRRLPKSLGEGDLLAILSAGAYGSSMASNYNSRGRPAEVLVQNGAFKLIRRRETFEDLIRLEIC